MSIGARIATWWPCSLPLPLPLPLPRRGLSAWGTWGCGVARPRHTERIVYVVGGQLEATVPHEPLHHPNGAELLQRDELSTPFCSCSSVSSQRRHEFGTTNGFGSSTEGRLLGTWGAWGCWTSARTTSAGSLSCHSLRGLGHIFSLYFFGS